MDCVNEYAHKLIENKIIKGTIFQNISVSRGLLSVKGELSKKRIMIFSPHPDDDVICMGGTIQKLLN